MQPASQAGPSPLHPRPPFTRSFTRAFGRLLPFLAAVAFAIPIPSSGSLKGRLYVLPGVEEYRLLVKFRAEAKPLVGDDGSLSLAASRNGGALPKRGGLPLRVKPAVEFTGPERRALSARAADGAPLPKAAPGVFDILRFAGLVYAETPGATKQELLALAQALEAREDVEYCDLVPAAEPPPPEDLAPPTPDHTARQGWLGPNPGIDCKYAWSVGAKGKDVRIADIEHSWGDMDHEDYRDNKDLLYGLPKRTDEYMDHGMAIWGILFAQHNGYGIDGCVPEAGGRGYSVLHGRPNALIRATADARPGDIILLEMQTGGPDGKLGPADIEKAVWDATRAATEAGRVVVGTAGNGGADLDATAYAAYRSRGDNGVIMEGAGSADTRHVHLSFSTYGSPVHVQGWGEKVVTTGYGSLGRYGNDPRQTYMGTFGGTSSGGGIVAAAVAAIQSFAKTRLGRPLAAKEMRELLLATGVPQGPGNHVGPLPNIRAAIERLTGTVAAGEAGIRAAAPHLRIVGRAALIESAPRATAARIRDAAGRSLRTFPVSSGTGGGGAGVLRLDLAGLPAGLHVLELRWPGGAQVLKLVL